jgi:hypothetical protein
MRWFEEFVRRLGQTLKGNRPVADRRPQSMANTDHNATQAASLTQAAGDRGDTAAGAPAEQGGQG